jgi:histidine kinase
MIGQIRRHLGWKLFLSYLIVIIVGVIVLTSAAELAIPRSFNRHMASMGSMMNGVMGDSGTGMDMNADLFENFRTAVNESLSLAAISSFIVAIVVSLLVSRRVVAPIDEMMRVSQRIAEGDYIKRVKISLPKNLDDLDELAQLAISINKMAEQLEKTETMRTQLIGDVAHELRTPLSTIKGYMEGLIDGVLSAENETFQQVHLETTRLQGLVDDLQELSRVESGAYDLDIQRLIVAKLVEFTEKRISRQFEEKGVKLQVEIPEKLPGVMADEDRIGQVLLNLVGNGLQYTPPGGEVNARAWSENDEVFVAIEDTGIGIPKEHLPHIFSRFYRVDKSRARVSGGSGIGLTISKHIVEAHNGRIWAESPGRDQGSTFFFTLPIAS